MGLGLIFYKTMSEDKVVLGYAIDNNLLEAHGWSRVCVRAQKTSDDKIIDKIRRQMGQLENATREIMEPKSHIGTKGVVPGSPKGDKTGPDGDSMDQEEELSPEFIKRFTCLK
jgi:hypothetical protein